VPVRKRFDVWTLTTMTSLNHPAAADHPMHSWQFAIREARYALPASHEMPAQAAGRGFPSYQQAKVALARNAAGKVTTPIRRRGFRGRGEGPIRTAATAAGTLRGSAKRWIFPIKIVLASNHLF
jgi:hypothetical protein